MIDVLPLVAAGILTTGAAFVTALYYPAVEAQLERVGVRPRALLARLTSQDERKADDAVEFEDVSALNGVSLCSVCHGDASSF